MTAQTPRPSQAERDANESRARETYAKSQGEAREHRRKIKKGTKTETFTLLAPETVEITAPKPVKRYPQDR